MRHHAQLVLNPRAVTAVATAAALGLALLAGSGAAAAAGRRPAAGGSRPAATGGTWGQAREVTGVNRGGAAGIGSVSCASAGNCSAAGYYGVGSPGNKVYNLELFVVSQVSGTWRKALEIPGTAALNKGQWAGGAVVSCAAPGRCAAAGSYSPSATRSNLGRAFVVSQR